MSVQGEMKEEGEWDKGKEDRCGLMGVEDRVGASWVDGMASKVEASQSSVTSTGVEDIIFLNIIT